MPGRLVIEPLNEKTNNVLFVRPVEIEISHDHSLLAHNYKVPNKGVARTLKLLHISKGDYWISAHSSLHLRPFSKW